jgi:hypothetical protein
MVALVMALGISATAKAEVEQNWDIIEL